MQFIRNVQFQVKQGKIDEFRKTLNNDVIPTLRKQDGFAHELGMVSGDRAVAISIWKDRASAEKYESSGFPKILEKLTPIIEGTPRVDTYELAGSSLPL